MFCLLFEHATGSFVEAHLDSSFPVPVQVLITVDDTYDERGATAGEFSILASDLMYIGGSMTPSSLPGAHVKNNFVGCMKKVSSRHLKMGFVRSERIFVLFR